MLDGERAVRTSASLRVRFSGLWAHLGLTLATGQLPPEAGAHRGEEGKERRMKGRGGMKGRREGGIEREGRQILAPPLVISLQRSLFPHNCPSMWFSH